MFFSLVVESTGALFEKPLEKRLDEEDVFSLVERNGDACRKTSRGMVHSS